MKSWRRISADCYFLIQFLIPFWRKLSLKKRRNSNLNAEEIINHVQPNLEAIKLGLPEEIETALPEVDSSSLAARATDTQWPSRCSSTYCEADDDQSPDENASAKQQTARKQSVAHSAILNSSMTTADIIRRLSQPTLVPIITPGNFQVDFSS